MNTLLTLSATELARRIRAREVSSLEVVEAHIAHIEWANPRLNAVVRDRYDCARVEAEAADRLVAGSKASVPLPSLLGVPCTIKESYATLGMPYTSGLVARRGILAEADCTGVRRFKRAGAIPLGVTNISELCMWMETNNKVYGRTNNPYDATRIVGGSTGGEGCIIGAGGSPFGLGGDVGGSIRMPAFFNGVFGHKPTGGLIPNTGHFPEAHNEARRYLTTGPLCRRAADLWPLVRLLAGPDGLDETCVPFELGDPDAVGVDQLTVYSVEGNGFVKVSDDLIAAQRLAADALASRGAKVEVIEIPLLKQSLGIWSAMMTQAGGPSFGSMLGNGKPLNNGYEVMRFMAGRSPFTLPGIVLALLDDAAKRLPDSTRKFVEMGRRLRTELSERLGPNAVLLYPSYTRPAPKHHQPLYKPVQWVYTAIVNVMELPSTQVPLGLNAEGLPLGVQVVGRWGNDHLTISVAQELERALGGWVPPRHA